LSHSLADFFTGVKKCGECSWLGYIPELDQYVCLKTGGMRTKESPPCGQGGPIR